MTRAARGDLATRIPAGASLLIDTSVVLAYLVGGEPASADAEQLFDGFVASGRNQASVSAITVGEILVRPFRQGSAAVAIAEGFLRHFADIRIVPIDYEVAREGARIRALTSLRMPDALILASARVVDTELVITSDRSWRSIASESGATVLELPLAAQKT